MLDPVRHVQPIACITGMLEIGAEGTLIRC